MFRKFPQKSTEHNSKQQYFGNFKDMKINIRHLIFNHV